MNLDPDVRKNVFMIYREALHNVVKHAHATYVKIDVVSNKKIFQLTISDNGTGYDAGREGWNGEGLRNMRKRAGQIGARFSIESRNGNGTTIKLAAKITRLRDCVGCRRYLDWCRSVLVLMSQSNQLCQPN
jgi:signal transduction histidine kinase